MNSMITMRTMTMMTMGSMRLLFEPKLLRMKIAMCPIQGMRMITLP